MEGLMKVATGGKLDCMDEGMTILRGLVSLVYKVMFTDEEHSEMDGKNILELMSTLVMRCHYHSTLEGIVVSQIITRQIMDTWSEPWNKVVSDLVFFVEVCTTMAEDMLTLTMAVWRFGLHWDPYNISLVVGKIIKIFV